MLGHYLRQQSSMVAKLTGLGTTSSAPLDLKKATSSANTLPVTPMMAQLHPNSLNFLVASGPFMTANIDKFIQCRE